nr:immunoglobulin light chain junction region [Macaca mulatta]
CQHTYDPPYSF